MDVILAAEGPFNALLARDLKLQWSQLLLPLGVRLVNALNACRTELLAGGTWG